MDPKCGTDIEYEDFQSGGSVVNPKRSFPAVPENGMDVPEASDFWSLVDILKGKTATDIFSVLANAEAESRYGSPMSTIRNVAFELEASDPKLAYALHLANWEKLRDSDSLTRLVSLAFRLGKKADGFHFARIARFIWERTNPFLLISESDFEHGSSFLEAVLAESVTKSPFDIPWLPNAELARFLTQSREYDEERLRGLDSRSKEAWEIRLRGLEFRWLTLLDHVSATTFVRTLSRLIEKTADVDFDSREFLAEYASSAPSPVAEAHYVSETGDGSIVSADCASVGDMLYRRFAHSVQHFLDHRFIEFHRSLEAFFTELDHPASVTACSKIVAILEKKEAFFNAMPDSANEVRNWLLEELSSAYGSAFYPKVRSWIFGKEKPLSSKSRSIGTLLLVDTIAQEGVSEQQIADFSEQLATMSISERSCSLIAHAFAARSNYYEAARWLARSNLDDVENSSLLLRIVADFRELSGFAIAAFRSGAPIAKPSSSDALVKVRALVSRYPKWLANEMLADAESAFWEPDNALELYLLAFEAGNADALKKYADLSYAMGRFDIAAEKYEILFSTGRFDEVAPRLCELACQKGNAALAGECFLKIDKEDPSSALAIAEYRAFSGDLFGWLEDLSVFPPEMITELPAPLMEKYENHARSLLAGVSESGKREAFENADSFASELLALRSLAYSFKNGPKEAKRYVTFLQESIRLSDDTALEDVVDGLIIGLLAPVHDAKLLGYAKSDDDQLRAEAVVDLMADEAKALAGTYGEWANGSESEKSEYSALLLSMSNLFSEYDAEVAGFFRDAGADAKMGTASDIEEIAGNPKSAVLH